MTEPSRSAIAGEAISGADAVIARDRAAAAGAELELFEIPTRGVEDPAPLERAIGAARRGRPPGAVNKSTAKMRDYLLGRGVNPLVALMQWAMHSPESLARELGCTKLEAFRELRGVWEGLAPFFMPKMAQVDDQGRAVPQFSMQFGLFGVPRAEGGRPPWDYLKTIENQSDSAAADPVSHGAVSHEREKPA